jgi:hypothetical protein
MAEPVHSCEPALTKLFAPERPVLGRYEVCATPAALPDEMAESARRGVHFGMVESADPLDAFGRAGTYDRSALARLYGGTRARVVHGFRAEGSRFESTTLISPHPDAALTRLMPGTLVIRFLLGTLGPGASTAAPR